MSKSVKRRLIIFAIVVFGISFYILMSNAFALRNQYIGYYETAVEDINNGDYADAVYQFERIPRVEGWGVGEHSDAPELYDYAKKMCAYTSALSYYENGYYREAYDLFITLDDFKDSAQYAIKCWEENDDR